MTESLIGTGALFHKAVNPAVVVEPVEVPLYLPSLTGIASVSAFRKNKGSAVVPASRNAGMNSSGKEGLTERVTVISFVRAQTHGCSDDDTINRTHGEGLVMIVGGRNHQREKVPLPINDDTPFQPVDTMFSRVSAVFLAPFFDFTTDASRYPLRQCR